LHLVRTERLRQGVPLSRVTQELATRCNLALRLLPMSDQPVRTQVRTPLGWLAFQEFFVRERCQPEVLDVAYRGAEDAKPAPGVIEALREADAVVICPSNPVSSVGPILAVPGIREAIAERRPCVTAVSPIVGGRAVGGPAAQMMRAKGYEVSPGGVADAYAGLLARLVIDRSDGAAEGALRARGVRAVVADSMMTSRDKEIALARSVLEAAS
jgi:LPPG:FO 2-phospho-L-lactate transferase